MLDAGHSLKSQNFESGFAGSPPEHLSEAFNALFESANAGASSATQGRQAAKLDNIGATLPPPPTVRSKTPTRWALKHSISQILTAKADREGACKVPGVCKCGTAGHDASSVTLSRVGDRPSVGGVIFCDSPWLCPTCAPKQAAKRAESVERVFDAVEERDGQIVFVTLTVKHDKYDSLAELKQLVQSASTRLRQGKSWSKFAAENDVAGVLVGPEVTYSWENGWHYHQHMAVLLLNGGDNDRFKKLKADKRAEARQKNAERIGREIVKRYQSRVSEAGGTANSKAQDVQVCFRKEDLSDYLTKGSAHWEVSNNGATKGLASPAELEEHQRKSKKRVGLTPWNLAQYAAQGGDIGAKATKLFEEYADVMPGTRSCVITPKLAEKLGLSEEPESDEGIFTEVDVDVEEVGKVERDRWHLLLRHGHVASVLQAVSDGWMMPKIEGLIKVLLREEDPPQIESLNCKFVSESELVSLAMRNAAHARTHGGRLQIAINDCRRIAYAQGKHLQLPNLKNVMQQLAA